MSSRRDLHKAKLRRDRIRREKHLQKAPEPPPDPIPVGARFAAERSMREIQALLAGQKFESVDDVNARLDEINRDGRLSERANAWMRDDPKWRAQELAYDALETDDFREAVRLVNESLKLDPDNVDASRLMVSLLPAELDNKIHLMREVVAKGEQGLGPHFFAENAGHFWGEIQTRPYMRAKQHMAELLVEAGEFSEAITIYERMLELNPNDNQGVRSPLLGLYLAEVRAPDAAGLLDRFEEEDSMPTAAWGRVMERWLAGDAAGAEAALERAREVNPFAEKYLSGARKLTGDPPDFFQPAKESGGQICALELARALEKHPGFREWLRTAQ